jgi:pSer/pThr/pTyr-binding forkhead associated (FHA) protein
MTSPVRLLERTSTPQQTREVPVTDSEFLIGRGIDCDFRLRVSEVSRHHCLIRTTADEVSVFDLGSSNGTYVNGQRVLSQTPLHTGDELRIGTCTFVVDLGDQGSLNLAGAEVDPVAATRRIPKKKSSS